MGTPPNTISIRWQPARSGARLARGAPNGLGGLRGRRRLALGGGGAGHRGRGNGGGGGGHWLGVRFGPLGVKVYMYM